MLRRVRWRHAQSHTQLRFCIRAEYAGVHPSHAAAGKTSRPTGVYSSGNVDEFEQFKSKVRKNNDEAHAYAYYAALLVFAIGVALGRFEGAAVAGVLLIVSGFYALGANGNEWSGAYKGSARDLENIAPAERRERARWVGVRCILTGTLFVAGYVWILLVK
jgi:hypothetical protein